MGLCVCVCAFLLAFVVFTEHDSDIEGGALVTLTPQALDKPICREQRHMTNNDAQYVYNGVEHPGSQVEAETYIYDVVEHPGSQVEAETYLSVP